MTRGITKNTFLSEGRFLREEISLMRIFGLAIVEGDVPPPSPSDYSVCWKQVHFITLTGCNIYTLLTV